MDNALIAMELFHHLSNSHNSHHGYFTLKLDVSKAYDMVAWVFLENMFLESCLDNAFRF